MQVAALSSSLYLAYIDFYRVAVPPSRTLIGLSIHFGLSYGEPCHSSPRSAVHILLCRSHRKGPVHEKNAVVCSLDALLTCSFYDSALWSL